MDDLDYFVFHANAAGTIEIGVHPQGTLITNVTLFDAQRDVNGDGAPDGVDSAASDGDRGISHLIYPVIAGGTYYLRVESKDKDRTGEYEVHIKPYDPNAQPGGSGTDGPPGPLPGWGGVRGVQINVDANGNGASRGGIDDPAEIEWFQIDGANAGFVEIRVAGINDDLKPFVTAFRADGGGIDTDSGEFDGQAKVAFEVAHGERIIVAVSSANGRTMGTFTLEVLQPATLPDDDLPDFGEQPRDMDPQVTDEGDGSLRARIEKPDDDDWVRIPIAGTGFVTIQVDTSGSTLIPFLALSRDGSSSTFFETDDGRDGRAQITFLPDAGQTELFAKISALDDSRGQYTLNVWRTQNPADDYPDAGGTFLQQRDLPANGQIFIAGRIDGPTDSDNFHFRAEQSGHVAVQLIPLTTGFDPFFSRSRQSSDPNQRTGTSGGGSGRGGRAYEMLDNILPAPDNQIVVDVQLGSRSTTPIGDYVLHVRQTQSPNDIDPETIGIEASPILLDGTGNGSLPGSPNDFEPPPALDFAGDVDVFQIVTATDRPITITVNGTGISGGTFLRIYDANRQPIIGDQNSGPNGESTVTLEANRGNLYYLEIQAFDGTSTGTYSITIEQPVDDHPDAPIFVPVESQANDATPIVLDTSGFGQATGQIGSSDPNNSLVGDRDLFQVMASQRGQMTVEVITTDNQLDTFLRVYDSRGNFVAIDDDGGDGRNSRITFNTFMDETYLIEVSGYADNSIGAYQVSVQTHERPRETFLGTYDDFSAGQVSDARFRTTSTGTGVTEQTGGVVRLQANGNRAEDNNNRATLESRAYIAGNVEFDFTPSLGNDENSAQIEFTNGTDFIRLLMESDGSGGITLTVDSSGYTEQTNTGPISLVQGQSYHVKLSQNGGTVAISIDGGAPIASFVGSLKPGTALEGQVQSSQRPVYDDFNDSSIDPNRWNTSGDVFEQGGRLHVWMYRDGGLRNSRATTQGKPGGTDIHGFFLHSDRTAGTVGPGQAEAWVGITNGSDYVRFRWLSDVNQMIVETGGAYGEGHPAARWDPDEPGNAETPDGPLEIRERNGNIEFVHSGTIQYIIENRVILPNSWFEIVGFGQHGENGPLNRDYELVIDNLRLYTSVGRFAELTVDNLVGEFALPNDPVLATYDDFNDNQIDFEKWRITGTVREEDGQLKLPIYSNEQPVSGYISTAGIPGGTNLRGFRVGTNRTANPKVINDRDITARMELTNGTDFIRVGWTMKRNSFLIETGGVYGSRTHEISIPNDQIPDGPIEVRERDGNIEVLHNGNVKFTISNQTVRAGSYFTFQTDGDPERRGLTLNGIEFYDAIIDNLEFYFDPEPYAVTVTPTLKAESDSGLSDADHITNQLSLLFGWAAGPDGTQYQWREGELQDDGSILYRPWNDPQSETTAQVELEGASIHVFSVRSISPEGIVGEENARAVSVDIDPPSVEAFEFVDGQQPRFLVQFDEPVYGAADDVIIRRDSDGSILQATSINGFGTTTLEILLPEDIAGASYTVTIDGTNSVTDVAGNKLDGDGDGSSGGNYQAGMTVPRAEIEVERLDGTPISDGQSLPIDFGTTEQNQLGPVVEFRIKNVGTDTLTWGTISLAVGFVLVNGGSGSLESGEEETITARLDASLRGSHNGQFSIVTNDPDEDPFNFSITGLVVDTLPPTASVVSGISEDNGISHTDAITNDTTPTFSWSQASDSGSGVAGYWWAIDNATPESGGMFVTGLSVTSTVADGTQTFYLQAEDHAGNLGSVSAFDFTIKSTAPQPVFRTTAVDPTNAASIPIQVEFGEVVAGFTETDLIVNGGTINNFIDAGGGVFTFNVIPASDGVIEVNLPANQTHDIAGNGNLVATALTFTSDRTGPSVVSLVLLPTQVPRLLVTFSENIFGIPDDIFIRHISTNDEIVPSEIEGLGTSILEIMLPRGLATGSYLLTLDGTNGFTDLLGNPLDGDSDNLPGGDFLEEFAVPLLLGGSFLTGAGEGGGPHVRVFDAAGLPRFDLLAYVSEFLGGVRVATGDVNGDGTPDILTAPGPSGGPNIRVFDGRDGSLLNSFFAYDPHFFGGVYVAAADLNGDQQAEIVTAADAGGGPHVRVFNGSDGRELFSFMAYAPQFVGGVRVATGDVNGDGTPDIITAPGAGGGPHVRVFDGTSGLPLNGSQYSFMAYDPGFSGGLYISAAEINGDGFADIITGAGAGGGPHVRVFDGSDGRELFSFMAYAPQFFGGVRVGASDVTGDGLAEIITSPGAGGGPHIRAFDSENGVLLNLSAYDPSFVGGVYLAGHPQALGQALRAADNNSQDGAAAQFLTATDIEGIIPTARNRLANSGLSSLQIDALQFVEFTIADLPGNLLGQTNGQRITLDTTAAGFGWFIDPTPEWDEEFFPSPVDQEFLAVNPQGIDLLTVLFHELSHIVGWDDNPANDPTHNLMTRTLPVGVRRLPTDLEAVFIDNELMDELLSLSINY